MSISTIRDGLLKTIQDYGKWSSDETSGCDFGITTMSGSCVILQPGPNTTITPISYGTMGEAAGVRNKQIDYDIAGIVMVKDPGDPTAFLGSLWTAVDDIYDSVNSDDTLNGSACVAYITNISRPSIDAFISTGDADFGFITFGVRAQVF